MNEFDVKRYIDISDFLSTLLGPDYEIILYDLKHIIYIINGDITWIIKLGIIPGLKSMTFKKKYDVDALTEFAEKLKGIGG